MALIDNIPPFADSFRRHIVGLKELMVGGLSIEGDMLGGTVVLL